MVNFEHNKEIETDAFWSCYECGTKKKSSESPQGIKSQTLKLPGSDTLPLSYRDSVVS